MGWQWFGAPENWLGAPKGHEPIDQAVDMQQWLVEIAGFLDCFLWFQYVYKMMLHVTCCLFYILLLLFGLKDDVAWCCCCFYCIVGEEVTCPWSSQLRINCFAQPLARARSSNRKKSTMEATDCGNAWLSLASSAISDSEWELAIERPQTSLSHRSCPWGGHLVKFQSRRHPLFWNGHVVFSLQNIEECSGSWSRVDQGKRAPIRWSVRKECLVKHSLLGSCNFYIFYIDSIWLATSTNWVVTNSYYIVTFLRKKHLLKQHVSRYVCRVPMCFQYVWAIIGYRRGTSSSKQPRRILRASWFGQKCEVDIREHPWRWMSSVNRSWLLVTLWWSLRLNKEGGTLQDVCDVSLAMFSLKMNDDWHVDSRHALLQHLTRPFSGLGWMLKVRNVARGCGWCEWFAYSLATAVVRREMAARVFSTTSTLPTQHDTRYAGISQSKGIAAAWCRESSTLVCLLAQTFLHALACSAVWFSISIGVFLNHAESCLCTHYLYDL